MRALTPPYPVRRPKRRSVVRLALVGQLVGQLACFTPRTELTVPACTERVEVEGPHLKATEGRYVLEHTWDLPFTRTELEVERADGKVEREVFYHVVPDVVRLVMGAAVLAASGVAAGFVGFRYATRQDEGVSASLLLVPVAAAGTTLGAILVLTGWQPMPSEIVVESDCPSNAPPRAAQ